MAKSAGSSLHCARVDTEEPGVADLKRAARRGVKGTGVVGLGEDMLRGGYLCGEILSRWMLYVLEAGAMLALGRAVGCRFEVGCPARREIEGRLPRPR